MRRRQRRSGAQRADATDLFLDAMSNAFGCIVLILLIVALQVQWSSAAPPRPAVRDQEQLEPPERAQARQLAALERLRARLEAQWKALGGRVDKTLHQRLRRVAELEAAVARSKTALETTRSSLERLERAIEAARRRLEAAEAKRAALAHALEEAKRKKKGYRLRVPRLHPIEKRQVGVFVYQGRVAFVHRWDPSGQAVGWNDEAVQKDVLGTLARPVPGAGQAVTRSEAFKLWWRDQLRRFSPARHYFAFAVWPESHEAFLTLREACLDAGFDYNLLLMKEDEPVQLGSGPDTAQ